MASATWSNGRGVAGVAAAAAAAGAYVVAIPGDHSRGDPSLAMGPHHPEAEDPRVGEAAILEVVGPLPRHHVPDGDVPVVDQVRGFG